jgi:hypothetical protein
LRYYSLEGNMKDDVQEIMQRTYRYYYADGLVEIAIGGLFLTLGFTLSFWTQLGSGSPVSILAALGMVALVIGGTLLVKRFVGHLKERVTYPRTGFVSYRRGEPGRGRWLILFAAGTLAILSLVFPDQFSSMALVEGLLLCLIFGFMGYRVGLRRFYSVALLAALLGLGAALGGLGDVPGSVLTFGGTGMVLLISGAVALRAYLSVNQMAGE